MTHPRAALPCFHRADLNQWVLHNRPARGAFHQHEPTPWTPAGKQYQNRLQMSLACPSGRQQSNGHLNQKPSKLLCHPDRIQHESKLRVQRRLVGGSQSILQQRCLVRGEILLKLDSRKPVLLVKQCSTRLATQLVTPCPTRQAFLAKRCSSRLQVLAKLRRQCHLQAAFPRMVEQVACVTPRRALQRNSTIAQCRWEVLHRRPQI